MTQFFAAIDNFTEECLSQVLPKFNSNPPMDTRSHSIRFRLRIEAREHPPDSAGAPGMTPGSEEHAQSLAAEYARGHSSVQNQVHNAFTVMLTSTVRTTITSSRLYLVNHYIDKYEGTALKRAPSFLEPGEESSVFEPLLFNGRRFELSRQAESKGASVAAQRSQELSDHPPARLTLQDFKMLLVAFFLISRSSSPLESSALSSGGG